MSPRTWWLDLPYKAPPLRDNDRMHWAKVANLKSALRRDARLLALSRRLPRLQHARVVLHWQPAIHRTRDRLSIAPSLKPILDGLIDYGLLPDDDIEHCDPDCVIEPVSRPARLWLEITDLSDLSRETEAL